MTIEHSDQNPYYTQSHNPDVDIQRRGKQVQPAEEGVVKRLESLTHLVGDSATTLVQFTPKSTSDTLNDVDSVSYDEISADQQRVKELVKQNPLPVSESLEVVKPILAEDYFFDESTWQLIAEAIQNGPVYIDNYDKLGVNNETRKELQQDYSILGAGHEAAPNSIRPRVVAMLRRIPLAKESQALTIEALKRALHEYVTKINEMYTKVGLHDKVIPTNEFLDGTTATDVNNRLAHQAAKTTLPFSYQSFRNADITEETPLQWSDTNVLQSLFRHNIRLKYIPLESGIGKQAEKDALLKGLGLEVNEHNRQALNFIVEHIKSLENDISIYADKKNIDDPGEVRLHEVFTEVQAPVFAEDYDVVINQIKQNLSKIKPEMSFDSIMKLTNFDFSNVTTSISFESLPFVIKQKIYDQLIVELRKSGLNSNKTDEVLLQEIDSTFDKITSPSLKDTTINNVTVSKAVFTPTQMQVIEYMVQEMCSTEMQTCIRHSLLYTVADDDVKKNIDANIADILDRNSDTLTLNELGKLFCITGMVQKESDEELETKTSGEAANKYKPHMLYALQFFEIAGKNTTQGRRLTPEVSSVFGSKLLEMARDKAIASEIEIPGVDLNDSADNAMSYTTDRVKESIEVTTTQLDTFRKQHPKTFYLLLTVAIIATGAMATGGAYALFSTGRKVYRTRYRIDQFKLAKFIDFDISTPSQMETFRKNWGITDPSITDDQIRESQAVAKQLAVEFKGLDNTQFVSKPNLQKSGRLQRKALQDPAHIQEIAIGLQELNKKHQPGRVVKILEPLIENTGELLQILRTAGVKEDVIQRALIAIPRRALDYQELTGTAMVLDDATSIEVLQPPRLEAPTDTNAMQDFATGSAELNSAGIDASTQVGESKSGDADNDSKGK